MYVFLDDDPNLFDKKESAPHLYLTSSKTGPTEEDVKKILKQIKQR